MIIFEGFPHTTSVLRRDEGIVKENESYYIDRIIDYDGIDLNSLDMTYVNEFVRCCDGIYTKWLNNEGGYSYWLFAPEHSEVLKTKSIGSLKRSWRDRSVNSDMTSLGKTTGREMNLFTKASKYYMKELQSVLTSPEVYVYMDNLDNELNGFVKVDTSNGNYRVNSHHNYQELRLKVSLPNKRSQTIA